MISPTVVSTLFFSGDKFRKIWIVTSTNRNITAAILPCFCQLWLQQVSAVRHCDYHRRGNPASWASSATLHTAHCCICFFWWAQVELTWKTRFFASSSSSVLRLKPFIYYSYGRLLRLILLVLRNFVPQRKEIPPTSIRYLPPIFVKYVSIVMNQVYSLLHPLILCPGCTFRGIYPLHGTIRAGFDSYPRWNDVNARFISKNSFQNDIRWSKYFRICS